jgi:hypothetical protein
MAHLGEEMANVEHWVTCPDCGKKIKLQMQAILEDRPQQPPYVYRMPYPEPPYKVTWTEPQQH